MPRLYAGKIKLALVPLAPKKAPRVPWAMIAVVTGIGSVIWFFLLTR